jgi:GTPase SAR1 family protein
LKFIGENWECFEFKKREEMASKNVSKVKVVFLGDQSVGKTSLLNRFMYDTFEPDHMVSLKQK